MATSPRSANGQSILECSPLPLALAFPPALFCLEEGSFCQCGRAMQDEGALFKLFRHGIARTATLHRVDHMDTRDVETHGTNITTYTDTPMHRCTNAQNGRGGGLPLFRPYILAVSPRLGDTKKKKCRNPPKRLLCRRFLSASHSSHSLQVRSTVFQVKRGNTLKNRTSERATSERTNEQPKR